MNRLQRKWEKWKYIFNKVQNKPYKGCGWPGPQKYILKGSKTQLEQKTWVCVLFWNVTGCGCVWFRNSWHRSGQQAVSRSFPTLLAPSRRWAMWQSGRCLIPDSPHLHRPLRMDQRRAEHGRNTGPVSLYGEFTLTANRKVRCAVSLTEKDLIVQRLSSSPVGRNKVVLSLKDCIGCRAYRGDDTADPAAYLTIFFYPLKRRWMSSGVSRQRAEQCFRLTGLQDPRANLEEAEKWARAVSERSARQQYLRDGECSLATRVHCPMGQDSWVLLGQQYTAVTFDYILKLT